VQRLFGLDLPVDAWAKEEGIADEEIKSRLGDAVERLFAQRAA
jgi:preprotein translocase subunit SecA